MKQTNPKGIGLHIVIKVKLHSIRDRQKLCISKIFFPVAIDYTLVTAVCWKDLVTLAPRGTWKACGSSVGLKHWFNLWGRKPWNSSSWLVLDIRLPNGLVSKPP